MLSIAPIVTKSQFYNKNANSNKTNVSSINFNGIIPNSDEIPKSPVKARKYFTKISDFFRKLREKEAEKYGLPKTASWKEIKRFAVDYLDEETARELSRKREVERLGLPEDTSWDDIHKITNERLKLRSGNRETHVVTITDIGNAESEVNEKVFSKKTGMLIDTPKKNISNAESEANRKARAKEWELPEDTSWDDIRKTISESRRKAAAKECGLSEDASWKDISKIAIEKLESRSEKIGKHFLGR